LHQDGDAFVRAVSRGKVTIAPTRFAEDELNELWDMRQISTSSRRPYPRRASTPGSVRQQPCSSTSAPMAKKEFAGDR
jgi:hypothetical protein